MRIQPLSRQTTGNGAYGGARAAAPQRYRWNYVQNRHGWGGEDGIGVAEILFRAKGSGCGSKARPALLVISASRRLVHCPRFRSRVIIRSGIWAFQDYRVARIVTPLDGSLAGTRFYCGRCGDWGPGGIQGWAMVYR